LALGIHGLRAVGATPGRPFLFLIPATGAPPLQFSTEGLPEGLALDAWTGIVTGAVASEGISRVEVTVHDATGATVSRMLKLVAVPNSLAQTPPMGWNSWNIWARDLTAEHVRQAADAMVSSGLAAHGYQYINLDDCWQGERGANGVLQPNAKFPDMKGLIDYVHGKGLKFGIYSSPGRATCAGQAGSFGFEAIDAKTYAEWGVDYLKYDWCSYTEEISSGTTLEEFILPHRVMGEALAACGRDIVYSLCQGGVARVYEWGPSVGGSLWRTTGDISDTWESMSRIGFAQYPLWPYAGPGHWNDPDMLVVGHCKWNGPSRLTQDEQVTHITLWSLLAAPLLVGCDLTKLDPFTIDLLCNDEVIDVDQDPLGKQAKRVSQQGLWTLTAHRLLDGSPIEDLIGDAPPTWGEVWARPLFDGTLAVGLFNRGDSAGPISVTWPMLGIEGPQPVRDLWLREDLDEIDGALAVEVPSHGAMLFKIGRPNPDAEP
jgi:alpha-galactosidase